LDLEATQGASDVHLPAGQVTASSFAPGTLFQTFPEFVDHLRNLPAGQWCNLYLAATIAKEEAIALGARVAEPISQAFAALAPMYQELVGGPRTPTHNSTGKPLA
jgi:hypothetical protein